MLRTLVDLEIAHQFALQRSALQHALHGLLDDALGELALEDPPRRRLLDAAGVAGVPVVDLVGVLIAGEDDLLGVDDDDVVAAVDVGRVDRLVLALEAGGDQSGQPADDEAVGVDQDPLLLHLTGFGDVGPHHGRSVGWRFRGMRSAVEIKTVLGCQSVHW